MQNDIVFAAHALSLTATVDNVLTIYNEGVQVATNSEWTESTTVTLDDPCVLALEGTYCVHVDNKLLKL